MSLIRRKALRIAVLFALAAASAPVSAGPALDAFTLGLEKEIGYNAYRQILAGHPQARLSAKQTARVRRIFARLTAVCGRSGELDFTLTVIRDKSVNAFALPGGYIFLHDSILSFAAADDELAGVMAHEIAHVDRKHGMRAVYRSAGMSILLETLANRSDPRRRERVARIGNVAIKLALLGYGREAEYEADRYAVIFMRRAGYDKGGFLRLLRKLEKESGGGKNAAFERLLSTHPPMAERIERVEAM